MTLERTWIELRARLRERGLWDGSSQLALRVPGRSEAWWGEGDDPAPRQLALSEPGATGAARASAPAAVPTAAASSPGLTPEKVAIVLAARADVLALAACAGPAGRALAGLRAPMPQCFDEQARHLGPFVHAEAGTLAAALAQRGQALSLDGRLLCLAPTAQRLALNAELMEKCATAALLAWGATGHVPALPALVRYIANRRLHRDQRRAAQAIAQGTLPAETAGY